MSVVRRACDVYSGAVSDTQTRALDAAVDLVGTAGLRALTHARVDERAGLPKGSTSNWFRTRSALLLGVTNHIVQQEASSVQEGSPGTAEQLVEQLSALVEFTTGPRRTMTSARLAVFMEASHNPELRDAVAEGRTTMEAAVRSVLGELGVAEHNLSAAAAALMACAEGLILHRIARGDTSDPRPVFANVVRGIVTW